MSGEAYPPPRSGGGGPPKAVEGAAAASCSTTERGRDDSIVEEAAAPSTMLRMVPLPRHAEEDHLTWLGIVRLGLVQTALGAIFVLSTSTLNRVMKVELGLPAVLPGVLIAIQYFIQVLRPRLGHGSDVGGRRTPLIVGGMAVLAAGGVLAALATATMTRHLGAGIALAVAAFVVIGVGVSACGTSLLVLLATRTAPARRPAAAGIAWVMMIMGFIVTAGVAGRLLDPFSPSRLVAVAAVIAIAGLLLTLAAVWGVEGPKSGSASTAGSGAFAQALREVWAEPRARRFALFVFVSMLAYGGEELMIEPFAGSLFAMTPGATARLSGVLHGGSLAGMLLVAVAATALARTRAGTLRLWMVGGCLGSGVALAGLAASGLSGSAAMLRPLLFALGLANGGYAIAAIGSMMQRIGGAGDPGAGRDREGTRMGLWGAAQAVAFGCGGLGATACSDIVREAGARHAATYAAVFATQAAVFAVAAIMAARLDGAATGQRDAALAVPVAQG